MSGIVGLVTFDGAPVDPARVEAMASAAPHRGLDGFVAWHGPGAALGYQRRQVLASATDRDGLVEREGIVCVADARIDNREELLAGLDDAEMVGREVGEAELVLAIYRRWGQRGITSLIGDFAFVIWDGPRRTLVAARDPMAMRSLAVHVRAGHSVAVATEVKQLLALAHVPRQLNENAVLADMMATFGKSNWSFYEAIENVPPGCLLIVDEAGMTTERFWAPEATFQIRLHDERDYADLVRDRLVEAVAGRLRTDRPAGFLLSGGVDSGSAASVSGWLEQRGLVPAPSLHAFCWAFSEFPQADERSVSRLITAAYDIEQTDIDAARGGPLADFPDHGPDEDDPMLGAYQPLIEHSLAAARDAGIGFMIGGDRGDLVFGDTGWNYLGMAEERRWSDLAGELRAHRRFTTDSFGAIVRTQFIDAIVARATRRSPAGWARWLVGRRTARRGQLATPPWLRPSPAVDHVAGAAQSIETSEMGFSRGRRLEWIFSPLHMRGMAWSERTYARYGVAFADPFSDRRVVELALAIPQVVINRPGDYSKPLVRDAMRGIVPEPARLRLAKVLPTPLYDHALRNDATATIRQLMTGPRVADHGWVDAEAWRRHFEDWLDGRGTLRGEWWWTLCVEIWLRRYW